MKGQISVRSKIGEGTEFTVRLPITREAPAAQPPLPQSPGLPLAEISDSLELPPVSSSLDQDLPTALIVEDHKDVARYIASCLEGRYHLEMAYDGQEGIDQAIELVPDIVISDVMMPEKDGYELTATLKRDERTSHIPILLLTAKADVDSKIEGLEHGADAYLYKPFEPKELEVRLRKLIELRQNLRERYGTLNPSGATEDEALRKEDAFLRKLKKVVEDHIEDETFGTPQILRAMGVSRTQLHNKLKALTGKSTSQVVRSIRLQKAKSLLQEADLNISEVAYAVGFKNLAYFSASFSEEFGVTPSEVRK
jgi:DNA-binding response OmpR family regulator